MCIRDRYIASALNVSGAPGVNLLVTGVVVFSLFLLKERLYSQIYKRMSVEFLEIICYVNIIFLSSASFYTLEANKNQTLVAYISGTIILILFLLVLIYHIFTEICSKTNLWNKLRQKRLNINEDQISLTNYQQTEDNLRYPAQPTVSWIDAPQCDQPLTDWNKVKENESETNKKTPLLNEEDRQ